MKENCLSIVFLCLVKLFHKNEDTYNKHDILQDSKVNKKILDEISFKILTTFSLKGIQAKYLLIQTKHVEIF